MRKHLLTLAAAAVIAASPTASIPMQARQNPFLQEYTTKYLIPPFEEIQVADILPAMKAGLEEQNTNLKKIVDNPETATFENTILPLENLNPILDRTIGVFAHYSEALSSDELDAISDEVQALINQASNNVALNDALFDRIKTVRDGLKKSKLTPVQKRLVEKYYRQFAERGAALTPEKKAELVKVNDELTKLQTQFNRNLLGAMNSFFITVYDKEDLAGLPETSIAAAADEAKRRGLEGLYVFTLHAPSRLPVLTYAKSRGLREAMYKGYTTLAASGQYDNAPVIKQIVKLRDKKAKIMGFDNFAQLMTSRVMAKTPEAAEDLLMKVFTPAVQRSKEEVADMQALADKNGDNITIAPWDYYYYAEQVKKDRYNFSEDEVRPYFSLENVLNGLFYCAEKLYGIKMVEMPDAPKYMDQVTVYDVQDAKSGEHIAVFMTDYFPRASKRQGAWMEQIQSGGLYPEGERRPIVYNVGNFTAPTSETPALLTLDEVETTFHEFGHALQGMLTRAPYRSLAGTDVDRDYVEMCSQINEHWAFEPEVLKYYAKHYKTGETIPDELIEKLNESGTFNQGFITTELAGAALLDMNWGKTDGEGVEVAEFEKQVGDKIGMPKEITYRYRSPYFKHIFGDEGYASGYYTYLWSQVLEADAWEKFQKDGIFNPKTAASFKKNILESGDTEDAEVLFKRFRGHAPEAAALLRLRGFAK